MRPTVAKLAVQTPTDVVQRQVQPFAILLESVHLALDRRIHAVHQPAQSSYPLPQLPAASSDEAVSNFPQPLAVCDAISAWFICSQDC